jgi:serine phosphatase RsbU (regulator of sigma subunit)
VIRVDDDRFAFVVGDVSGRGIEAAALMARLRFTLRAYLVEGHPPDVALRQCSQELDVRAEGRMATVLVGVGDLRTREVTLASAGHFNPLQLTPSGPRFLDTAVGCPLGMPAPRYQPRTFTMPAGSTLVAFTDGLVERRGEAIDAGLARLAKVAGELDGPLEDVVEAVLQGMSSATAEDDIALLALRWTADDRSDRDARPPMSIPGAERARSEQVSPAST